MSDTIRTKCPYCGSSLLSEEDGYRCRFCKSFFPYDSEQGQEQTKIKSLSQIEQQAVEKKTPEELKGLFLPVIQLTGYMSQRRTEGKQHFFELLSFW